MKKRFLGLILTLLMLLSLMPVSTAAEESAWKTIYVSTDGNDNGDGTKGNPFKTPYRAQEEVRKYNENMQGDIVVQFAAGRYEIRDFLEFNIEDSGSNGFDVIYRGEEGAEMATFSGAEQITGTWTEDENGIWHTQAENIEFARDLFINDVMATRARSAKKIYAVGDYIKDEARYSKHYGDRTPTYLGFYVEKTKLGLYENPEDVTFNWSSKFRAESVHVDDIIEDPDNPNQVIAILDREFWHEYSSHFRNYSEAHYSRAFVVENAYELLDQPGEFYFNKKTKRLSYIPREGEDMNTAEVFVPVTDQLIYVRGGNVNNCTKNIRFENIRFAHTVNHTLEEASIAGGQAQYHYSSYEPNQYGTTAVLLDWADEVDFEGCVFFGLEGTGVHFRHGVYDSEVIGNVFADIGADAFAAGLNDHEFFADLVEKEGPMDGCWKAGFSASYLYWPGTAYTYTALNTYRADEHSTVPGVGWYSEPWAKEEGTLPWVKIHMEAKYKLENVRFSFPDGATEEERSNFEVLISNDRSFKEYKVLKTYTDPANFKEEIPMDDDTEYRFIMFRKTVPGPFCLNGVWADTYDLMPEGIMEPERCTIANNYFTRPGTDKWECAAIWLCYTDSFKVLHNEIYDTPYSGMGVGWNWQYPNDTARDNVINYNRVGHTMNTESDGGPLYIFGEQPGTEIRENYFFNTSTDAPGLYFDVGAMGMTADSNVTQNTGITFNFNAPEGGHSLTNHYTADCTSYMNWGAKFDFGNTEVIESFGKIDPAIPFSYTDMPDEVARIIGNAGIEDEWLWIKDRIPEGDTQRIHLRGPDGTECQKVKSVEGNGAYHIRAPFDVESAQNMLATGTFGILPWQFAPESKLMLERDIADMNDPYSRTDDDAKGHNEEDLFLQDSIRYANASVIHPVYEDMLTMCDELLAAAKESEYGKTNIAAFKSEVEKIKHTNPETRSDKAVAANRLEKAYTKLYNASNVAKLNAVVVENAEYETDFVNRKTIVKLPFGVGYEDIDPMYFTSYGVKIPVDTADIDYSEGKVTIPLLDTNTRKYSFWNVEFVLYGEVEKSDTVSIEPTDWVGGNVNTTYHKVGDSITIAPYFQPSMCAVPTNGTNRFSLLIPRADTLEGISIIFSAQTEKLLATDKEKASTYYALNLRDQLMTLSRVEAGVVTPHIQALDVGYEYGSFNDFDITVTEEHGLNRVVVKLSGKILIDTLVETEIGQTGYFGILSKNMEVKIK